MKTVHEQEQKSSISPKYLDFIFTLIPVTAPPTGASVLQASSILYIFQNSLGTRRAQNMSIVCLLKSNH